MQEYDRQKMGFPPVYDADSRVLILGSFPSVKSRQVDFYYGNPQNRFWKMLCGYFGEEIPPGKEEKRNFLLRHGVALWDMVCVCDIVGSSDSSIKNAEIVRLETLLSAAKIRKILLNGTIAYKLFLKKYENIEIPYEKMPSTSPANLRYDEEVWREALDDVFKTIGRIE